MSEENILENPDFDGEGFFKDDAFSEIQNEAKKIDMPEAVFMEIKPIITEDEFFDAFKTAFKTGSICFNLQSLEIQDDERGARLLSNKLYSVFSANPLFRKLLENGGILALDWFVILSWAGKKAVAVTAEKLGTDSKGAVEKIAEKAGKGFIGGIFSKLKFWGKKENG